MKTAAEHWEEYERMVVPHNAPPHQRFAMKGTFYAGMLSAFNELASISDEASEDAAVALTDDFHKEVIATLRDYKMQLEKGEN